MRLAGALWWFWWVRGPFGEGRAWLQRALAASPLAPPDVRARGLLGAGLLAQLQSDHAAGTALVEEGLATSRATGDEAGIAVALIALANALLDHGPHAQAELLLEEALPVVRRLGDHWWVATALNNLAIAAEALGDPARAAALAEEALRLGRELGDDWLTAFALNNLAGAASAQGEHQRAAALFGQSLALAREHAISRYVADALVGLADVAVATGGAERAARLLGAADALCETVGGSVLPHHDRYRRVVATVCEQLGEEVFSIARAEGELLPLDQLIAEAGTKPVGSDPSAGRADGAQLTPRELEVLHLIAAGRSNREIAEALYITHRTAQTHVAHILAKLDVGTRAEAGSWAVRHGLA